MTAPDITTLPAGVDVDGSQLLDDVRAFLARYVAFPSADALTAVTSG